MRVVISVIVAFAYLALGATAVEFLRRSVDFTGWIEGPLVVVHMLLVCALGINTMVHPGRYVPGMSEPSPY